MTGYTRGETAAELIGATSTSKVRNHKIELNSNSVEKIFTVH
jgi:hypothetical protein